MARRWWLAGFVSGASLASSAQAQVAAPSPLIATIDASQRSQPVSRYEYGMFIEPIGNLVARTLWAEMLDDRKFYFPVVAKSKDPPTPQTVEGRPGATYRKWRPIGGDDVVIMDRVDQFVGKQSASVVTDRSTPHGLQQAELGVAAGRRYDGYVWLSGDSGAKVQVALVWGEGPNDRQVVSLPAPSAGWNKATFSFTPSGDSANAR